MLLNVNKRSLFITVMSGKRAQTVQSNQSQWNRERVWIGADGPLVGQPMQSVPGGLFTADSEVDPVALSSPMQLLRCQVQQLFPEVILAQVWSTVIQCSCHDPTESKLSHFCSNLFLISNRDLWPLVRAEKKVSCKTISPAVPVG